MESERSLIDRVLAGDRVAFRELMVRYERLVLHVVARLLDERSDPQEVVQDVFIRVYRGLPNFRGDAKLSTWIGRIAYNTAAKRMRSTQRREDAESEVLEEVGDEHRAPPVQLDAIITRELRAHVRAQIARLPPEQRVAVTLHHLDGLPIGEVAEIMSTPVNTVKSHLFRGRKALKELLKRRVSG